MAVGPICVEGKHTLYHNFGKANSLKESYVRMGLDVWETVVEAPVGDVTLKQVKESIGNRITKLGNLDQVEFFKKSYRG